MVVVVVVVKVVFLMIIVSLKLLQAVSEKEGPCQLRDE